MKRILSGVMAFLFILSLIPSIPLIANAYSNGYYTYTVSNGEATITDCSTSISGAITIPTTLDGYPVTSIGADAFFSCANLSSIIIPNSVIRIGEYAFSHCDSLISIEIPESVTSIADNAFRGCDNLKSVKLPDSVTYIGHYVFYNCPALTIVTFGKYVTYIADYAFGYCKSLTSVIIPDSVTCIRPGAFYECSSLTNVTLGKNIETIFGDTFKGCGSPSYVWYNGSEEGRNNISLYGGSDFLDLATWHYNCCDFDSHIYDNACDDICNTCGCIRAFEHIFTNSCDTTCDECGLVRSITHVYDDKCDAVCNVCSYERSVPDHVYTNSCDTTCNECDAVRSITHIYDYICDKTCNVCGHERDASHVYDNADDVTCNICKQTLAPVAPILESVTDNTVTLVAVTGYEYSKNGTTWQKNNVFTGLQPFTSYNFYQRVAETPDNLVSPASLPLTVKTDKYMPDAPTPPTVYSKTGTSVTLQALTGYEYSIDGAVWQESNVFTGLSPVTEYTFYQRIAETSNGYASAKSQPFTVTTLRTFTVTYIAKGGNSVPEAQIKDEGVGLTLSTTEPWRTDCTFKGWSASVWGEVDYSSGDYYTEDKDITLYAVWVRCCSNCGGDGHTSVTCTLCDGTGEWWGNISTCCYARTAYIEITHGSSGYRCLNCGKVCNVEYGSASCDKTKEISCQSCSGLGYGKLTPPAAPQPELLSATLSSITVVAQSGIEYSIDGVTWQVSNVFDDLSPNTQYTIYQRYEENDYYNAGQTSEALSVSTLTNYTVVFKNWDGTILSTETYQYGDTVIVPADPIKAADRIASYTFTGWDKPVVDCAGDATYTATYKPTYIEYTIVFKNWNGTVLSTEAYHWGDTVVTPANPSRPNDDTYIYTFIGWDKPVIACYGNAVYTAVYNSNTRVPSTITSSDYTVSSTTISKITAGTTVSSLLSGFNEGSYCKVYKGNAEVSGNTAVGTGMIVKIMDGNAVKASYTIIVTGDTNGDGNITVTDMIAIKAHVLKKSTLSGVYATAADTNGDNGISITDFIQVKAKILGKGNITAR